jgi:hypothetical protein
MCFHSLPVKYCMLNPIELAWAGLKTMFMTTMLTLVLETFDIWPTNG